MIIILIWALIFFVGAAFLSGSTTLFSLGMACLAVYFILKEWEASFEQPS